MSNGLSWKAKIEAEMDIEKEKAWKSLAGYKFYMFGYHAAAWVKYNKLLANPMPNPFKDLVHKAREISDE